MADPQFEEFQTVVANSLHHIQASSECYRLIHDLTPDQPHVTIAEHLECSEDLYSKALLAENLNEWKDDFKIKIGIKFNNLNSNCSAGDKWNTFEQKNDQVKAYMRRDLNNIKQSSPENFSVNLQTFQTIRWKNFQCKRNCFESSEDEEDTNSRNHQCNTLTKNTMAKRRRKLPEIPKNKKPLDPTLLFLRNIPSLAEELYQLDERRKRMQVSDDLSPEDGHNKFVDVDSGTSTVHSPVNAASPTLSTSTSGLSTLELLEANCRELEPTHHVLHKFIPRHSDELELEIGDPVYVQKEADDLWCEGINLHSQKSGVFPCSHIVDVEFADFDPELTKVRKERFLLEYLGSVQVVKHRGIDVICQAVRKIVKLREDCLPAKHAFPIILEISEQGIHMLDRNKPPPNHVMTYDYFYNLKNVTFCGYHPNAQRYFGFITRHPVQDAHACHILRSQQTTRNVTEAVGRAFHRFYEKFLETAYPIEDIYIE
ncbi:MAPK8IP1 (predicted) [Pycnogonum litorale]